MSGEEKPGLARTLKQGKEGEGNAGMEGKIFKKKEGLEPATPLFLAYSSNH